MVSEYDTMLAMDSPLLRQWEMEGTLTKAQEELLMRIMVAKTEHSNALDRILFRYLKAEIDASNETHDEWWRDDPEESYDWDDEDYSDRPELPPAFIFGPRPNRRATGKPINHANPTSVQCVKIQAIARGILVRRRTSNTQLRNLPPDFDAPHDVMMIEHDEDEVEEHDSETEDGTAWTTNQVVYENFRWLNEILLREPQEAIQSFHCWFEGKVVQVQAMARGYLVRKRFAEYRYWLKGTLLEGAPWDVIQDFESTVYDRLLEDTLKKIEGDDEDSYDEEEDLKEESFDEEEDLKDIPLRVLAHMRAILLKVQSDRMRAQQTSERMAKEKQRVQPPETATMSEKIILESMNPGASDSGVRFCPTINVLFYSEDGIWSAFVVSSKSSSIGLHGNDWRQCYERQNWLSSKTIAETHRSEFRRTSATLCIQLCVRAFLSRRALDKHMTQKQELEQALERQRQELRKQCKVRFTMLVAEYNEDGTGQAIHRRVPTLTSKEW